MGYVNQVFQSVYKRLHFGSLKLISFLRSSALSSSLQRARSVLKLCDDPVWRVS